MLPKQIEFFAKFIERELGIVYSEHNRFQLVARLEEVTKVLGLKDTQELYDKASERMSGEMRQLLLDTATNNETSFFRDPKIFDVLSEQALPELIQKLKRGEKVRIWSAASSFGQEPYSLSMLFHEKCADPAWLRHLEIRATDIAARALERAQAARFTQLEVQRGLSAVRLVKYFEKDGENYWTLRPELRKLVRFGRQNLLEPFDALGEFDLIFCRNVLIYQSVENKKKVIGRLSQRLVPGGCLVLGAGESLIGLSEEFDSVRTPQAVFYRIKGKKAA